MLPRWKTFCYRETRDELITIQLSWHGTGHFARTWHARKCRFWLTFVPRSIQHKSQQIPTFSNQLKITTTHLRPPRHNPHFSTFQIFFLLKPTEKTVIFFYKFFLFTAFHSPLYTCLQKIVTFLYLFPTLTTF